MYRDGREVERYAVLRGTNQNFLDKKTKVIRFISYRTYI